METDTVNKNEPKKNAYERLKSQVQSLKTSSNSVRFHRDTDNLDFDGRD